MSEQHYDVIGDVHGHADALRRLLVTLGYAESQAYSNTTPAKQYLLAILSIAVPNKGKS